MDAHQIDEPEFSYADPADKLVKRQLIRLVERATGQRELRRLYLDNRRNPQPGESFFAAAVRRLQLDVQFDPARLARIPRSGPLVIVANHPYGVLDGIVLSWLVQMVRNDFYVLTNAVLLKAPEVRDYVLPVDFANTPEATKTNIESRAKARDHLAKGGAIVVFPAGGVSTAPDRLGRRPAIDAPWQPFTGQLIQRAKATVVPVCFSGQNSRLFQIASHMSLTLRLSLIFHEVHNRIGTSLPVAIGEPIPYSRLAHIKDRQQLANELRALTYGLAESDWSGRGPRIGYGRRLDRKMELPQSAFAAFLSVWDKERKAKRAARRAGRRLG